MDYTAIQWDAAALVVIDVQQDFVDGALPVPGTVDVLPQVARLLDVFRAAARPVVHAIRLYDPAGGDVDLVRRRSVEDGARIVAPGSPGAGIPAALTGGTSVALDTATLLAGRPQRLADDEVVMYKPRWSAFHRTGLQQWLEARGVTSLLVAGCNLPNCPRATLFDATERDFRAGLVTDAVSGTTPERLADLQAIGVQLVTTGDAARQLA